MADNALLLIGIGGNTVPSGFTFVSLPTKVNLVQCELLILSSLTLQFLELFAVSVRGCFVLLCSPLSSMLPVQPSDLLISNKPKYAVLSQASSSVVVWPLGLWGRGNMLS